jgi:hypothetical protein
MPQCGGTLGTQAPATVSLSGSALARAINVPLADCQQHCTEAASARARPLPQRSRQRRGPLLCLLGGPGGPGRRGRGAKKSGLAH